MVILSNHLGQRRASRIHLEGVFRPCIGFGGTDGLRSIGRRSHRRHIMTLKIGFRSKLLARVAMPILVASGLCACSDIPDWVDPTTWIGGDIQTASDQDQASNASTDTAQTPDIASIPDKPAPPSTSDEQKQVTESLEADRTKSHYSTDALRGGTEAAAPPPSAEAAPPPADQGASNAQSQPSADTADAAAPAASESTGQDQSAAATPPPAPAPAAAPPPASEPSASQMASADTASASEPVAAPMPAATATENMQATFAPSSAPPLDPSVSRFVPQPILSRYQQTAAGASASGVEGQDSAIRATHRHRKKAKPVAAAQP